MWPPTGLIPWFSKTDGNTYATLLHHPFLFKGKTNACSRGSKKDFWRRCRGGLRKSQHTKYPSQPLSPASHYLPFASRFTLPHFTLAVLFALLPSDLVLPRTFFLLASSLAKSLWILIHLLISLRDPIMMNLLLVS